MRWPWQRRPRRAPDDGAAPEPTGPIGYTGERLLLDPAAGRWFDAGGNPTAAARLVETLGRHVDDDGAARVVAALAEAVPDARWPDDPDLAEAVAAACSALGPTRAEMLAIHAARGG